MLPGAQSVVRKRSRAKLAFVYILGTRPHTSQCSPIVAIFFFLRTKFASRYIRQHNEIAKSKPAVQSRIRISSSVAAQLLHVRIRGLFILSCAVDKVLTSQSSNNSPGGILTQLRRTMNVTQRKRVEQTGKQILH